MRIVVCLDGSELSRSILPPVVALAESTGAEVDLVHVMDVHRLHEQTRTTTDQLAAPSVDPHGTVDMMGGILASHADEEQREVARRQVESRGQAIERLERQVREALEDLALAFPRGARVAVLHGRDAAPAIVTYAQEQQSDLIAMATHSRRGVGALLWGSVTDAVVRTAGIPVVVVHPAA